MADPGTLIVTAALMAAQMGMQAMQHIEGPRLTDLKVSVADYGTPLNYVYGRRVVQCPAFFSEDVKERKKRRKGKGGKQTNYTYFGTAAWHLADHPIVKVWRIWFDNHLVYDATGSGEALFPLTTKGYELASYLRIYYGSEDQEPDPRMLATVTAQRGAGKCSAYKGMAYLFAEDFPLEQIGNRYPQVKAEISTVAGLNGDAVTLSVAAPLDVDLAYYQVQQSANREHAVLTGPGKLAGLPVDGAYAITEFLPPSAGALSTLSVAVTDNDGTVYYDTHNNGAFAGSTYKRTAHGGGAETMVGGVNDVGNAFLLIGLAETAGGSKALIYRYSGVIVPAVFKVRELTGGGITTVDGATVTGSNAIAKWGADCDRWGDCWTATIPEADYTLDNPLTTATIWRVRDGGDRADLADVIAVTGLPEALAASEAGGDPVSGSLAHIDGYFVIQWAESVFCLIDETTGAVVASIDLEDALALDAIGGISGSLEASVATGDGALWIAGSDGAGEKHLVQIALPGMTAAQSVAVAVYDQPAYYDDGAWPIGLGFLPATSAFAAMGANLGFADIQNSVEFLSGGGGAVTLGSILSDVAERGGLEPGEYSFVALDQPVAGYSWTPGQGKQIVEPLLTTYHSRVRPHDFLIEGIKRGAAPIGTIDSATFVHADPPFKLPDTADRDLPARLTLTFADLDSEQQPNTARAPRVHGAVTSEREQNLDMQTLALDPSDARQLLNRYHRTLWFARGTAEFGLTRGGTVTLEPGDVYEPVFDGDAMTMSLDTMTIGADGTVQTTWSQDDPALAVLSEASGAPALGYVPSEVYDTAETTGEVLDLPLLSDAHDQAAPLAYLAAGPNEEGPWPGADFAASDDAGVGSYVEGWGGVSPELAAVFGTVTEALPEVLPWSWDRASEVTVTIESGALTGATDDQLLDDGTRNLALIGGELVQFTTATLTAPLTYTVSGFLRGVRGTEAAIAGHAPGERFVLLDGAAVARTMGAGELGDTDHYVVTTVGGVPDEDDAVPLAYTGASHRPYSPVHGTLTRDAGSGDWAIDATRRTRIGGASLNGQDVPLGEASEAWEADIYDGATFKRTLSGASLPLTYTAAQQTTDFGAPQAGGFEVNLYQMSPALSLRGYPLALAA